MGRSGSFSKKDIQNKKDKKRKDKEKKRLAKRDVEKKTGFDDMIAYVDENGNITSTPPDPEKKKKVKAENIEISVPKRGAEDEVDKIRKGTVTFFNTEKGYGFIKDSETKEGVFVHVNNILEEIKENNLVCFEVEKGQKGLTAVNVKLYKEPKKVEPVKTETETTEQDETETEKPE